MLYGEFLKGTGCKDNETNYKVYKDLEIIYMNTDCTKEHIYEYGKKLVDNSKTAEEIAYEKQLKQEIANHKECVAGYKAQIANEMGFMFPSKVYIKYCKDMIKYHKDKIRLIKELMK